MRDGGNEERTPLLGPEEGSPNPQEVQGRGSRDGELLMKNQSWTKFSWVIVLCLVVLSFIVAVIEKTLKLDGSGKADDLELFVCFVFKIVFSFLAIGAVGLLMGFVLTKGEVPRAHFLHNQWHNRKIILTNLKHYIPMSEKLGHYPSTLFIVTYVIFAIFNSLSAVINVVCNSQFLAIPNNTMSKQLDFDRNKAAVEITYNLFLLGFTLLQTQFFVTNFRRCIQWRLSFSCIALSVLLATNVAIWFFTVAEELQEVNRHGNTFPNGSYCSSSSISDTYHFLYPFQIEYCVMSALIAHTLMINAGKFVAFMHQNADQTLTEENFTQKMRSYLLDNLNKPSTSDHESSEMSAMQEHPWMLFLGLIPVLVSLSTASFDRSSPSKDSKEQAMISIAFYFAVTFLHVYGIFSTLGLLCYLKRDPRNRPQNTNKENFSMDRVLLWLSAAALVSNNIYRGWKSIALNSTLNQDRKQDIFKNDVRIASCFANIFQCIAQLATLEFLMISQFSDKNLLVQYLRDKLRWPATAGEPAIAAVRENKLKLKGLALLNLLLLVNVAEWFLSALCFPSFFTASEPNNEFSLVVMPLQIFYRFHSAACIHDFKNLIEKDSVTAPTNEFKKAIEAMEFQISESIAPASGDIQQSSLA